jgi:hypothetical protein
LHHIPIQLVRRSGPQSAEYPIVSYSILSKCLVRVDGDMKARLAGLFALGHTFGVIIGRHLLDAQRESLPEGRGNMQC